MDGLSLQIALRKWCELLDAHAGRDKILRITGFICTLLSDLPGTRNTPLAKKFLTVGRQISNSRTINRLFDDLPMLNRTLSYGIGSSEKDQIIRISNLISNVINTCYYPLEHLAWFGDQQLLAVESKTFWRGVSYCWASTMYLAIVRTVRTISMLIQHRRHTLHSGNPSDSDIMKFRRGMLQELLSLIQQMSDMGIAVNSIPGFLWGGKLKPRHIGILGIVSTFISLAKLLRLVP
ncbi:peroxisomal membrane protein 11C-like [Daphnia pulex]|uniref:peroxisomal membrane protein 11C-like n=1 Tax=Daphnia pulex TaxID=6669 RepID=UPI001EDF02DF|nr:peroxisomal membrane protein 11C-like [Daphnia pulex]